MSIVKEYRTIIERINLTLNQYVENGFVMFGKSKSGMTAAAHLLSGSKLTGFKINGEPMVAVEDSQHKSQKIGKSCKTQTIVPNKFEIKLKNMNKKVCLIEGPGFGNSHGALGILSSGYAHMRIFQRVKNIKFFLCFDQADLHGNGQGFIETMREFLDFFKDFEKIQGQIMISTAFLFTKVTEIEKIKGHLKDFASKFTSQLSKYQQNQIKDFINHVITKDAIFCIKKAQVGQVLLQPALIDNINEKLQWWTRDISKQPDYQQIFSSIDMSPIKISLLRQLQISCISGIKSKNHYNQLINYYQKKIKTIFGPGRNSEYNITFLLNLLVEDFMSQPNDCKIFQQMRKFISENTFNNNENTLGSVLNQVKKDKINKIYQDKPLESYNMEVKTMRLVVKKFKVLQEIQNQFLILSNIEDLNYKYKFGLILKSLQNIFNLVHGLALWFGQQELVKTYFYELSQLINELRYLHLVFDQNQESRRILQTICINNSQPMHTLFINIKLNFGNGFDYQNQQIRCKDLLKKYVKRLDIDKLQQSQYIIDQQFVEVMFNQQIFNDQQCKKSLINLIQRYSDMVIERMQLQQQNNGKQFNYPVIYTERLKKQLFLNIFKARKWAQQFYYTQQKDSNDRFYIMKIKRLTSNLAQLFLYRNEYSLAIKLYDSVNMVSSVCRVHETILQYVSNDMQVDELEMIINQKLIYVDYLVGHFRIQKAISVLNDILSDQRLDYEKLSQISNRLIDLRDKQFIQQKNKQYEEILLQREYFKCLGGQLQLSLINFNDNDIMMV